MNTVHSGLYLIKPVRNHTLSLKISKPTLDPGNPIKLGSPCCLPPSVPAPGRIKCAFVILRLPQDEEIYHIMAFESNHYLASNGTSQPVTIEKREENDPSICWRFQGEDGVFHITNLQDQQLGFGHQGYLNEEDDVITVKPENKPDDRFELQEYEEEEGPLNV